MPSTSSSQSLESVSLRLSQKQFEPEGVATIDPPEGELLLPELDRAKDASDFRETAPSSTKSSEVLAQIIDFAHRERISDLQFQAGRFVYANGGGSTRPCEQWGKFPAEALPEILELFFSHRAGTAGVYSHTDATG